MLILNRYMKLYHLPLTTITGEVRKSAVQDTGTLGGPRDIEVSFIRYVSVSVQSQALKYFPVIRYTLNA